MKKIYMTMVALLCGVTAMAQVEASLEIPEKVEVAAGSTADVTIGLTSSESLAALGFRFLLPEGCTLATKTIYEYDEELDEDVPVEVFDYVISEGRSQGHDATIQFVGTSGQTPEEVAENTADNAEGWMMCAVAAAPNNKIFKKKAGDIITLKIACAETAKDGTYEFKIKKAAAATLAGVSVPLESVSFPVVITGGTGIHSINADDVNAPIYNVAGQRVSKAQKGVYIQNGKKVAVK